VAGGAAETPVAAGWSAVGVVVDDAGDGDGDGAGAGAGSTVADVTVGGVVPVGSSALAEPAESVMKSRPARTTSDVRSAMPAAFATRARTTDEAAGRCRACPSHRRWLPTRAATLAPTQEQTTTVRTSEIIGRRFCGL
jgi:hypothetical protein